MTAYKVKTRNLVFVAVAVILATFAGGWIVGTTRATKSAHSEMATLDSLTSVFVVQIANLSHEVVQREQEVSTVKEALRKEIVTKEELRKLNIGQLKEITKLRMQVDTLLDSIPSAGVVVRDTCLTSDTPAILLPFSFAKKDQWMDMKGFIGEEGMLSINMKLTMDAKIYTGYHPLSNEYEVTVTTANPYIKFTGMQSQRFAAPKQGKWTVGAGVGMGIGYHQGVVFTPTIGLTFSRDLIRF